MRYFHSATRPKKPTERESRANDDTKMAGWLQDRKPHKGLARENNWAGQAGKTKSSETPQRQSIAHDVMPSRCNHHPNGAFYSAQTPLLMNVGEITLVSDNFGNETEIANVQLSQLMVRL